MEKDAGHASSGADAENRTEKPAAQNHAKLHAMLLRAGTHDMGRLLTEYEGCRDIIATSKTYNTRARRFLQALDNSEEMIKRDHLLRIAGLCFVQRSREIAVSTIETMLFSRIYHDPKLDEPDRKTLRYVARALGSDDMSRESLPLFSQFRLA